MPERSPLATAHSDGSSYFVWTRVGAEGGQTLKSILAIKEAERQAGNGVFWWGVGNSLGDKLSTRAKEAGGGLDIIFSQMLIGAHKKDSHPAGVCLWTIWEDTGGQEHEIPGHVLEWSAGTAGKAKHYALVCHSDKPIVMDYLPFDKTLFKTVGNKIPGDSQISALLRGDIEADQSSGKYTQGFRAKLIYPWMATLVKPRFMSADERSKHSNWKTGMIWKDFVKSFRE